MVARHKIAVSFVIFICVGGITNDQDYEYRCRMKTSDEVKREGVRRRRDCGRMIDIKVSSRRDTERRNRMLLKAAFIMAIDK